MNKTLYAEIDVCNRCPYLRDDDEDEDLMFCLVASIKADRTVPVSEEEADTIPEWCPLPDAGGFVVMPIDELKRVGFENITRKDTALTHRVLCSIDWMLKYCKWKYRQEKNIPDELPDNMVDWSKEMKEAIGVYSELSGN